MCLRNVDLIVWLWVGGCEVVEGEAEEAGNIVSIRKCLQLVTFSEIFLIRL
jgi:hypothetical protein